MMMLDTNVLVRAIAADDETQAAVAKDLLANLTPDARGFISLTTIVELVWVLERVRGYSREQIVIALDTMLRTDDFEIEDGESVSEAVEQLKLGADFADALIDATARLYGCVETVTFDRKAANRFGWRLLG